MGHTYLEFDQEVSILGTQRKEIIIVVGMEEIREAAWRRGYLNWALKTR